MMSILPWLSLVAIVWLQAINGTSTDFSAYSSHLKSRLSITQVQLNNLAVASDAGKLFGWCSGLLALYLPLPVILIIGGTIGLFGYGIQFLFLANKIPDLAYWQVIALTVLAGNSLCWINTACYLASMLNFPADQGTVVSLSTSYSALSAKIYIAIVKVAFRGANDNIYLLLNSVAPMAIGIITSPFIREAKQLSGNGDGNGIRVCIVSVFVIASLTGVYSIIVSVVPMLHVLVVPQAMLLVMVVSIAGVPLVRVVWNRSMVSDNENDDVEEEEEVVKERGGWKLVVSMDFWLYFWVYLCGATLGLVFMNNLGQISQSRGVDHSLLLSISSSFGFFGKLASAPVSAFSRSKYMVSRPAAMVLLMAPMAGSFFLLLDPTMASLFVSTAVIGMCSGAMASIAVYMTAELFGRKHFAVNHNILIANIPLGSFLFGYMAGYNYDKESSDKGPCRGVQCYRKTFILWGLICSTGALLSVVLYFRRKKCAWKEPSAPV